MNIQETVKNNVLKQFSTTEDLVKGLPSSDEMIEKLEDNLEKGLISQVQFDNALITIDLIKGGEGSRGGKIIGHTKSGKPVYASKQAKDYKNFTSKDHEDAGNIHHSSIINRKNDKVDDPDRGNGMIRDDHHKEAGILDKKSKEGIEAFIQKESGGNMKALKFTTEDKIDEALEKLREDVGDDDSSDVHNDKASSRFEDIYGISPSKLKSFIKNKLPRK